MSKRGLHYETALALVKGNGEPRTADQVVAEVERTLAATWADGHAHGVVSARANALRESLAIAKGAEADASRRVKQLEIELAQVPPSTVRP